MKTIRIGSILSVCVAEGGRCEKDAQQDCLWLTAAAGDEGVSLFLFQGIDGAGAGWCYDWLGKHLEEVVGPSFQTSVQRVEGDSWAGYQAVTALSETRFLVNRVIASKVSDYAARLEFTASNTAMPEHVVEMLESLIFVSCGES